MTESIPNRALMCLPEKKAPRVVVIGGGFGGLALVSALSKVAVQVVLIDRQNFHQFQPLFYQVATSGLEPDSILFPYRKELQAMPNCVYRYAEVQEIDATANLVHTDKGSVPYDYLVLATGTKTNFFGLKDIERHGLGMKSIQESLDIRHKMIQCLEQAAITCDDHERDTLTNFIIVGGGPAGVEMAGAMAEFKKYILPKDYPEFPPEIMNIYMLEAGAELLSAMSDKSSRQAKTYLDELGVHMEFNETVVSYDGSRVYTRSDKEFFGNTLIWTAGVTGDLPIGIETESMVHGNRLLVDSQLRVKNYTNVFGIGDIAAMITDETPHGHPQVAQVAIQQGKYLGRVIEAHNSGKEAPKSFEYKDKGSLATIGKRRAVADLGEKSFAGYTAWLLWSVVHLFSISGFRNRTMVALNWTWSYFSYEKGNRLIVRPYEPSQNDEKA